MSVSSLRLKGFKSFGKQCEFEFSKNFTAIVGPNGSGKSNILDALKWILGEGAASGLRITRQSDLLFQGSSSVQAAKIAEVVLRFSGGTLRRTYSQENGAVLFFDGKKILLQDLSEIKARFNFEGEGFALIGQGEISQTIHQKPKERRRQLDALFGIERYRERRDDSLKKLEDTYTESQRIKTLIDELNSRRSEISGDVEIAVQAQGIIDNLDVLRHDYYFFRRYANETEQADLDLQKHIKASRLEELNEWLNIWTGGLKFYEAKLTPDSQQNLYASQLEEISAKKNAIQRRAFQTASHVKEILSRRKALNEELETLVIQRTALEQERERTKNEHDTLLRELETKQQEFSEREKVFAQAREKSRKEIARRKKILDDIAKQKLQRSRIQAELEVLKRSRESGIQELQTLEDEQKEKEKNLDSLFEKKKTLDEKFTSLTFSCQNQHSTVQTFRRELTHLESQYQNLSNTNFFSEGIYPEPVRAVLAASRENILHSKPRTAAEVFSCSSPEVAAAIEAYLGGRQYWLLVHTLEEAQEGIDFLKANRAGRATYLALERCRPREKDFRLNISGKITGWAMDLITVKNEWYNAVVHIMGDLLIVQDYETASTLVRSGAKFPVATLEGEVFAPSGTVSGGASRQRAGAVSARQKMDEINAKLEEIQKDITVTRTKLEESITLEMKMKHEFEEVGAQLESVKSEIHQEQRNIKAAANNIERMRAEHENFEIHSEKLQSEYQESERASKNLEHELEWLKDIQEQDYNAVIMPMKNELRLIQERLNVTRTLYERVDGEYKNIKLRIEKAEHEITSGQKLESEDRKLLFSLSRDKVKIYHEELTLRELILKHNDEFESARKRIERLQKRILLLNENISGIKNNISEIDSKIAHLENERAQLIELWDYKYPYDKNEAKNTEGGRDLISSLRKLERELKSLGSYNLGAISEDESLAERIDFLTDQLDDVNTASTELKALISDTDSQVEKTFTSAMAKIDSRFNALFQRLFAGGEARLTLQECESIWDRGVEIFARPPGKKLQNISQLSGGEQSLTSIALIFATLEAAGTPLAVLDEVDAALDEYNLIRFAELAKEYSQSIQIIAMTHRRATMERADLIYGVTMIEPGLSATVGINPENYA